MLSKNDLPAISNENEICFDRESSTSSNKSFSSEDDDRYTPQLLAPKHQNSD